MNLLKNHRLWIALSFLLPFAAYVFTAYPSVPSEDAGELIAAAYTLGIAHPPGYPLYVILGKIWATIIPFGNVAWKINVLSGLFAALTVSTCYAILNRLTESKFVAVATSLTLAFTPIFWSQAIRAEVYTLNALMFALVLYFAIRWSRSLSPARNKWLYILSFVYGLSIGNHHQILLIAPALAFFVLWRDRSLWKKPKSVLKAILAFLLGLAVYLYLPIRSLADPILDWGNPETWQGFWDVFFRRAYGDSFVATTSATQGVSFFFPSWSTRAYELYETYLVDIIINFRKSFHFFAIDLFYQYHLLLLVLIYGIYSLFKRKEHRPIFWLTLTVGFFTSIYLLNVIQVTSLIFIRLQSQPFFILFYVLAVIPIAYGLKQILDHLKWRASILLLLAAIPALHLFWHFPLNNQRHNYIAHDVASQVLAQLPQDSVLFMPLRDSNLFPLFYFQAVAGVRPDVTIYAAAENVYPAWEDYQTAAAAHPNRPIFTFLPLELNPRFTYLPGPVFSRYIPQSDSAQNSILPPKVITPNLPIRGAELDNLSYPDRGLLASYYTARGIAHGPTHRKEMEKYFNAAKLTAPDNYEVYFNIGHYYGRIGEFQRAYQNISEAYALNARPEYRRYLESWAGR